MIIGSEHIQSKREYITFRIKRSSIFLFNNITYEIEPYLAISLGIETLSGQEFSLKTANSK